MTFLLYACCSLIAYGQDGKDMRKMSALTVKATDAGSGRPVQMATVYIVPEGDTLAAAFSFTDKRGMAILKDFAAGRYTVNVQLLGFKPYAQEMELMPMMIRYITVALEENIEELQGACITEMGDLVTMKGDTLIYNAASFRTAENASLGDLLKKMPGIKVDNGRVTVNGEPVTRITVEGRTFFFDDQSKALENLPAFIVNQIRVIDKENEGRFGLTGKRKEMDVRLKDEYRESWFGRVSAEGGVSVREKSSDMFGDGTDGLYNAKVYAQFFGEDDSFTLIGGGNNVNANKLSGTSSGLSDIASVGVNYNTSRIPNFDTDASATYDFRNDNNRSVSHRTSFLSSGEQIETNRSRTSNDISHSAKAGFEIGPPQLVFVQTGGFNIKADFHYSRKRSVSESTSSTSDSAGEELNGSESRETGNANDFNARVSMRGKYYLDKDLKHVISFGGSIGYDGTRGNSGETSVTRYLASSENRSLLYTDKDDGLRLNGYADYSGRLSGNWSIFSDLSVDFAASRDNRDAENAADKSRNDWYSRYATDRSISLMQRFVANYGVSWGEKCSFNTNFGVGIYEDNAVHYSRAFGAEENNNSLWQANAGPSLSAGFRNSSWMCSLQTNGKSVAVPRGDAVSTLLDVSNPVDIATGNIYLKPGYHQDAKLSMSHGSRRSGKHYLMMRLYGSIDMNDIARASWYDDSAVRYSIPVNARRPRYNAGLNMLYIQPLNRKRSLNLTVTPEVFFSAGTMYVSDGPLDGIDKETFDYAEMMAWLYGDRDGSRFYSGSSGFIENRTRNLDWSVDADLKYELKAWSLSGGASVTNARTWYSASPEAEVDNWRYSAYAEALWKNSSGWEAGGRFVFNGYSGFSSGYNRPDWLLNMRLSKSIGKFTVSLSAYDILGNSRSFTHTASAEYVEDTYRNNIGRCFLVGLSYNFGKWTFAKRNIVEAMEKRNNL